MPKLPEWLCRKIQRPAKRAYDNVSDEHGFVFIHIPKNAGTSVARMLGLNVTWHFTVVDYLSDLGVHAYDEKFSFCFVRNPFDRFLSLYNYARMEESYYHSAIDPENAIHGKHMDYDILKNASVDEAVDLLVEGRLIHNPPHCQWNPQTFWLKDDGGSMRVNHIGRFEDVDHHVDVILKKIGVPKGSAIPVRNVSSGRKIDYKKLINPSSRQKLEEYYKEDLEAFAYEF